VGDDMADSNVKTGKVKKPASRRAKKDWVAAYVFIAPVTIGLLIFYIWPFVQNVWFSFNEVNKFNMTTFVGVQNYVDMVQDKEMWKTFGNTLKYVVCTVPVGLFLSICIAALLNSKIKGTSIYRTLYFLPSVTMAAAVAMVWKWIYNEKMGILNSVIRGMGGKGVGWLTDPKIALFMIMIVGLWMTVGYNMIILLAGMQGISKSYYEAAAIDGAGSLQQFFKITIPMLTPTIFFVMITSIISGFQVFDVVYMMIGKTNPAYASTQTVVMLFYRQAFDYGYKGYAAAISILIFAVIMLVTVVQLWGQKKWVNYD
jgi:multiple sugar transport system permease protein